MLKFIIGRVLSGKTQLMLEMIKKDIEDNKDCMVLVPEQFSFESEKTVLRALGESSAQRVPVMSFSRLCDEYKRLNGGEAGRTIGDSDKILLTKRAATENADRLSVFKNQLLKSGFIKSMADTVSELKLNAVSSEELEGAARAVNSENLAAKLKDTAVIYESYNALLEEKFIDPSDRLTKLYNDLEGKNYFKGKNVYIDAFKGFTGQQYKIIERIISSADNVTVLLCCDENSDSEFGVFSNILGVKKRITAIAEKYGAEISEDLVLDKIFYDNPCLNNLEAVILGKAPESRKGSGITVCKAESVYDEAEFVARNIRKLVIQDNIRYNDIVVIARDPEPYLRPLEAAFKRNSVPLFADNRIALSLLPISICALSAVRLLSELTTENILKFYKSGLEYFTQNELCDLENYAYIWNISGKMWETEWDMNPSGLTDRIKKDDGEKLERLNILRKKAIEPISEFRKIKKSSAAKISLGLISLFEKTELKKSYLNLCDSLENSGDSLMADAVRRSYDGFISALDSIAECYGETELTPKEFEEALITVLSLSSIGVVPQSVDEVTFGAADLIRISDPKYVFILGANQGVFPAMLGRSGIFSNSERTELIALGLDIPDKVFKSYIDEDFLVYSNVCRAKRGVYISYRTTDTDGKPSKCSAFVQIIKENLDITEQEIPSKDYKSSLPMTYESAFYELGQSINENPEFAEELKAALSEKEEFKRKTDLLEAFCKSGNFSLTPENSSKLFSDSIYLSASKLETFSSCRFMFFCKYGLNIKSLQPAAFDNMQRGTFVHYCLERLISVYKKKICEMSYSELDGAVECFAEEYLDKIKGYRTVEDAYLKYIKSVLLKSVKFTARFIAADLAQSGFEPVKCELKIGGENADIEAVTIPVDNETNVKITGSVDRVDEYNSFIRIIDYKTGSKVFKLPDVLVGQNMQMLVYLYALIKSKNGKNLPAGIFYLHAKRGIELSELRMNGLMSDDPEVLKALESESSGEFIPSKRSRSSFISNDDFCELFKFVEEKIRNSGRLIKSGDISAAPTDGTGGAKTACEYCEFYAICRVKDEKHIKAEKLSNEECMEQIRKENSQNGNQLY